MLPLYSAQSSIMCALIIITGYFIYRTLETIQLSEHTFVETSVFIHTTRPPRAPHPYNDPSIEAPQHLTQTRSPGRTSCTDTVRPACFTKAEAGCFTSARSPSTMTASIFCLNCLRKGSMSAYVVR